LNSSRRKRRRKEKKKKRKKKKNREEGEEGGRGGGAPATGRVAAAYRRRLAGCAMAHDHHWPAGAGLPPPSGWVTHRERKVRERVVWGKRRERRER